MAESKEMRGSSAHINNSLDYSVSVPTKLSIAIITRRFGARFGGAEAYAENLTRELIKNHNVRVFCQEFDSQVEVASTLIPRLRLARWLNQLWFNLYCHVLTRKGYDIVHSHENSWVGNVQVVHVMPVRFSLFRHKRSLLRQLSVFASPRLLTYLVLERFRFRMRPNCILVVPAQQTLDQLRAVYRNLPATVIIHPGVTLPSNTPERDVALASLGLDTTAIYCLLVANDPLRKGLATILRAMETLDDRFHLIVLGGDAACHAGLRAHIPAALASRVHTYPARTDVGLFYACGDLYLHPTLQDSFGMAPLEAMSYGMPVIISSKEYCGFSACVEAGSDALVVVDPRDASELALAIHRISHDPVLRATLCANGFALARRFEWRAVEQKFIKTYTEVLAGGA